MRLLLVIVLLLVIKAYTSALLVFENDFNRIASSFIDYDLRINRLTNLVAIQHEAILEFSKSNVNYYTAIKTLSNNIESCENCASDRIVKLFNDSKIRSLLNISEICYSQNPSLSKSHNILIATYEGYNAILSKLSEHDKSFYNDRPYLVNLNRAQDSMRITLAIGMQGKVENINFVYKGDTIKVDSLPINFGNIEGDLSFIITDSITGEREWFTKRF